ncbi:MAG: threonine ammonia-lyase, biosynthetic [Gammaproteobacteria bacterium]|nr:threonine ammonia-lyase, biosynthetic [Gammaproteobacteria bacterium]
MKINYLQKILTARVYDVAEETPLDYAANLSRRLDNHVWLKREDEQSVFSFKLRGAYNKMAHLSAARLDKGVVTASAGNHAQGVALSANVLGCSAVIVMPETTPQIKVDAVRNLGGKVVLHGDNYDAAYTHARKVYVKQKGLTFIHPYDDPDVIAGQGTIGQEIIKQHKGGLDAIFVPVGGGGLISGIAAYVKAVHKGVKIIGVEPADADAMYQSLKARRRVKLDQVGIFADGVAVRQVGKETFSLVRKLVDEIICVSTDEICAAIKDIFEDTRTIMEPAGALAVAGLKKYVGKRQVSSREFVALTSGANMNFDQLRHVSERAELGERREAVLAVTIPEQLGSFRRFCSLIGKRGITEFNYRYAGAAEAHVFTGIQISDGDELKVLIKKLKAHGYSTLDLTDNEMAKVHVRHLVGGHAPTDHEIVYRFEFPERPGALLNFLTKMGQTWNISLFHYRNHGADFGRVLVGMQVPPKDARAFQKFLKTLGYAYVDETDNPAYRLFLS